jgi:hypothetical protein
VKHLKIMGLCLVAVFAIAAVAASSASALPEWGKCEAKAGGKFSDANCTVKAKSGGSFEWKKGSLLKNVPFEGHNVGSGGVLNTRIQSCSISGGRFTRKACEEKGGKTEFAESFGGIVQIECESEGAHGETTGSKGVTNVSVKFLGCKVFGSAPCSNGPVEGEIQVNPLKGELGYISKSEHKVGVLLTPSKKGTNFAQFNCAGIIGTVVGVGNSKEGAFYEPETKGGYDGIISPITPVNQMTKEYTQHYTYNPETHENIPSKFEGKHIELLEDYIYGPAEPETNSSGWSPAGEEVVNVNVPTEEGEIKG